MSRFWSLAAAHWPLSLARIRLEAAIGPDHVAELVGAGVLQAGAMGAGDRLTCSECRGTARLVAEDGVLVAVCTGVTECPVERLGSAPQRVYVEPEAFARALAAALGLEGAPGVPGTVQTLGRRAMGEELVAFDLVGRPGRVGLVDALHRIARGGPPVRVLLVPDGRRLAADLPTEVGVTELVWVGLEELVVVDGGMRVDLRAVAAKRRFRGFELEEAFDGLVVSERGARWRGQALELSEKALALRLLRVLAEQPGEVVLESEIWRALYPDQHTRGGNLPRGANPEAFRHKLRAVVSSLRTAFEDVGLADEVVVNERGVGYLLALPAERVRSA